MTIDYDKILEDAQRKIQRDNIAHDRSEAREKAHKARHKDLTPEELAERLKDALNIKNVKSFEELETKLTQQACTLDTIFYTALHTAGLGLHHDLKQTPLQTALLSQRQCRQTFDSLKALQNEKETKTGKRKEETEKWQ